MAESKHHCDFGGTDLNTERPGYITDGLVEHPYLPSEVRLSVSLTCQLFNMSHSRTVRSHEALARMDWTGLKHRQLTGPSWPPRTYSNQGRRQVLLHSLGNILIDNGE